MIVFRTKRSGKNYIEGWYLFGVIPLYVRSYDRG